MVQLKMSRICVATCSRCRSSCRPIDLPRLDLQHRQRTPFRRKIDHSFFYTPLFVLVPRRLYSYNPDSRLYRPIRSPAFEIPETSNGSVIRVLYGPDIFCTGRVGIRSPNLTVVGQRCRHNIGGLGHNRKVIVS